MKTIHLIAAAALLTFASCSNDEVVESPAKAPIGFDSFIGKTTRATDATLANVNSITAYGYIGDEGSTSRLFDSTIVSNTGGNWTYSPLKYWTAGKNYFFTALSSPVTEGNSHYNYTWSETLPTAIDGFYGTGVISYSNTAATGAGNEDLIYAFATKTTPATITADPGRVQFAFKHALSRVKFTFNNNMGSDAYTIRIHDLTINNTAAEGTLTLGDENPTWVADGSTTLQLRPGYYTPADGTAANDKSVVSGTKFIIPESDKALTISFQIDLIVSGNTIATYTHSERVLPTVSFKNGFSYNFVADITPENIDPDQELFPILFNVTTVEGWTTPDENHTITLE